MAKQGDARALQAVERLSCEKQLALLAEQYQLVLKALSTADAQTAPKLEEELRQIEAIGQRLYHRVVYDVDPYPIEPLQEAETLEELDGRACEERT